jgi:hypothetical protein
MTGRLMQLFQNAIFIVIQLMMTAVEFITPIQIQPWQTVRSLVMFAAIAAEGCAIPGRLPP